MSEPWDTERVLLDDDYADLDPYPTLNGVAMALNPNEPTDMTFARAAKLVRDHAANLPPFDVQAMRAEASAIQGMTTPEHADPECSSDEIASIMRVHAARIAKLGNGWPMIATDLSLAAQRLEAQAVQLDTARLTVQRLLDEIADNDFNRTHRVTGYDLGTGEPIHGPAPDDEGDEGTPGTDDLEP